MSRNKSTLIIAFLILSLAASLFLVFRTTIFIGKATSTNSNIVALENSYLFASPLQAKADGKEKIRITVFLLDGRGVGISNQPVSLKLSSNVVVNSVQPITDDNGKAIFDLSSNQSLTSEVIANNQGQKLPQKVKITFY